MVILTLVGPRPQIIKEAALQMYLNTTPDIQEILVHSGQHYDYNMSDVFFRTLGMRQPKYNLGVGSGTHAQITGKIILGFEPIVLEEKPDVILVYGDTDTTIAGALVGAKLKIPVAHVEAGMRTNSKGVPEEINAILTDHVSTYLFAPSLLAVQNLARENIVDGVYFVGDIMYDLFLRMQPYFNYSILDKLDLQDNNYIVATIHRDYNTDDPTRLQWILTSLKNLPMHVVMPLHPRTRKRIQEFGYTLDGLDIIEPLDYLSMMGLVSKCAFVITDSGGLQKEAYYCHKRAIVISQDTAWKELIGWNILSYDNIFVPDVCIEYRADIYGAGNTAEQIINILRTS